MIDPKELYELQRVDELDKGVKRFVFRSNEQVLVGKHLLRRKFELDAKDEEEAWKSLKEKLEKSVDEN